MPKETTTTSNVRSKKKSSWGPAFPPAVPPCVVFTYQTRRIALPKPALEKSYGDALILVRQSFKIDCADIVLQTSQLPECDDGEEVEVPPATWKYVLPNISRVTIVAAETISITVACDTWKKRNLRIEKSANLANSLDRIMQQHFGATAPARADYGFDKRKTVEELGLEDGDEINVYSEQCGGKPVIYLFPPAGQEEMDVTVSLALVPQWKFSATYPVVPTQREPSKYGISGLECVTWDVRRHQDGTMTERTTGLNVSHLCWEAVTQGPPPSPTEPPVHELDSESFDPNSGNILDDDAVSVVLPLANATPYLDAALKVLGMHTEARTSFITHWLPSFRVSKHTHVALRFISQDTYERAAPLNVVPKPDVITRVFMLFKGVPKSDLGFWPNATARFEDPKGLERWRKVVGLGAEDKLKDDSLFRVLECGGMEVKR